MFEFLKDKKFTYNLLTKQHFVLRGLKLDEISWQTILDILDQQLSKNPIPDSRYLKCFENHSFVVFEGADQIPVVKNFLTAYNNLYPSCRSSAHIYISLKSDAKTYGRHNDDSDVLFWQIQGKSRWIVEQNEIQSEYVLDRNDAIYIPKRIYHEVIPLGARAGISFGLDRFYKDL